MDTTSSVLNAGDRMALGLKPRSRGWLVIDKEPKATCQLPGKNLDKREQRIHLTMLENLIWPLPPSILHQTQEIGGINLRHQLIMIISGRQEIPEWVRLNRKVNRQYKEVNGNFLVNFMVLLTHNPFNTGACHHRRCTNIHLGPLVMGVDLRSSGTDNLSLSRVQVFNVRPPLLELDHRLLQSFPKREGRIQ